MTNKDKDVIYKLIGEKVRILREEKAFSQKDLSSLLGISRASISNIELGRHQIPIYSLYTIADKFGIKVSDILPTNEEIQSSSELGDLAKLLPKDLDEKALNSVKEVLNKINKK